MLQNDKCDTLGVNEIRASDWYSSFKVDKYKHKFTRTTFCKSKFVTTEAVLLENVHDVDNREISSL